MTVTAAGSAVKALETSPRPGAAPNTPGERAGVDCCCLSATWVLCARRAAEVRDDDSVRRVCFRCSGAVTVTGGRDTDCARAKSTEVTHDATPDKNKPQATLRNLTSPSDYHHPVLEVRRLSRWVSIKYSSFRMSSCKVRHTEGMSNEQKVRQLTTSWARGENARLFSGLPISRLKRPVRRIMRSAAVTKAPKNRRSQHPTPHHAQLRMIAAAILRCGASRLSPVIASEAKQSILSSRMNRLLRRCRSLAQTLRVCRRQ